MATCDLPVHHVLLGITHDSPTHDSPTHTALRQWRELRVPLRKMQAFISLPVLPTAAPRPTRTTPICSQSPLRGLSNVLLATAAAVSLTCSQNPAIAASMRLPPINRADTNRCTPSSSAIGQANAARDEMLDLRECDLRGYNLSQYDLSGGIFINADLSGAKLVDAQLSKSYAPNASFRDVDFSNAIADRVTFDGSDLTNGIFANAVLSDSTFDGANLENVDFTDVYIGDFAQRNICKNPTVKGTNPVTGAPTRESLGCR